MLAVSPLPSSPHHHIPAFAPLMKLELIETPGIHGELAVAPRQQVMLDGRVAFIAGDIALAEVVQHYGCIALIGHMQSAIPVIHGSLVASLGWFDEQQCSIACQHIDPGLEAVLVVLRLGFGHRETVTLLW